MEEHCRTQDSKFLRDDYWWNVDIRLSLWVFFHNIFFILLFSQFEVYSFVSTCIIEFVAIWVLSTFEFLSFWQWGCSHMMPAKIGGLQTPASPIISQNWKLAYPPSPLVRQNQKIADPPSTPSEIIFCCTPICRTKFTFWEEMLHLEIISTCLK